MIQNECGWRDIASQNELEKGTALSTDIVKKDFEILEDKFIELIEEKVSDFITKPHMATRAIDALDRLQPFQLSQSQ